MWSEVISVLVKMKLKPSGLKSRQDTEQKNIDMLCLQAAKILINKNL